MSSQLASLIKLHFFCCEASQEGPTAVQAAQSLRSARFPLLHFVEIWIMQAPPILQFLSQDYFLQDVNSPLNSPEYSCYLALLAQAFLAPCRSLKLHESSSDLLSLAGSNLQKLCLWELMGPARSLSHFTNLSALRQLTLITFIVTEARVMRPLHKLRLLELRLCNCSGVAEALFVPGSLPALQTFAFEERHSWEWDGPSIGIGAARFPERLRAEAATPQAQQLGRAVFGHPSLLRVTGKSRLSYLDLPAGWVRQGDDCTERAASH